MFRKIIKRAGLTPWPKAFQNLRASRQTGLEQVFPTYVACKWMGNGPKVAAKHYLQTAEEHFDKAVQNPVLQASELLRNAPHPAPLRHRKTQENNNFAVFSGVSSSGGGT